MWSWLGGWETSHTINSQDLSDRGRRLFGEEPHGTYNRILLSHVLGGHQDPNQLWLNPLEWYEERKVFVHSGVKAETIDRSSQVVIGGGGRVTEPYDVLVLATGSRPFVPPMEGVMTFLNRDQPSDSVFITVGLMVLFQLMLARCERPRRIKPPFFGPGSGSNNVRWLNV